MNEKWIETLLKSAPLEVADEGFSEKIMAEIKVFERRRLLILAPFFALGLLTLAIFFPYEILENMAMAFSQDYQNLLTNLLPVTLVLVMIMAFWFSEEAA